MPRSVGWKTLLQLASSEDNNSRLSSLARAYPWLERALDAAGVPRKDPVGARLSTERRIVTVLDDQGLAAGLSAHKVRAAIKARHMACHEDVIPGVDECTTVLLTFQRVWHALSRHFVNRDSAAQLASQIAVNPGILAVCLYGSLARGAPEPNDIDFLVLDDGTFSAKLPLGRYADGTFKPSKATISALDVFKLEDPKLQKCASSKWLDIMVIDGTRLGKDDEFTRDVQAAQPDPWFFVNVSRDLQQFDVESHEFRDATVFPFMDLKQIFTVLERFFLEQTFPQ